MIQKIKSYLQNDPLIRRVLRNSSYLFSSNTLASALGVLQGILVFRLLGDSGSGLLAIVMDFPSNVNRLLSFRMSEVTVKYVSEALEQGEERRAAALVKGIGLAEAVTSVIASASAAVSFLITIFGFMAFWFLLLAGQACGSRFKKAIGYSEPSGSG